MTPTSAGLLLFRRREGGLEVLLGHPGGPFFRHRDEGSWTLPKGLVEEGEELLEAARREFEEEIGVVPEPPFLPLGQIRQRGGKVVHAWAWCGEWDDGSVPSSNEVEMEWPRGSGRRIVFPEIDRAEMFDLETARRKMNAAQIPFLERLAELIAI